MVFDIKFNDDNNLNIKGVIFSKTKLGIEFGADIYVHFSSVTYTYARF
jgi:hypothetical protein